MTFPRGWHLTAALLQVAIAGCAFRTTAFEGTRIEPISNAYSRNSVAAVPTLVGNVVGTLAGLALGLPAYAAYKAVHPHGEVINNPNVTFPAGVLFACIYTGGVATGSAFVPVALLLPEDPWEGLVLGDPFPPDHALMYQVEAGHAKAEAAAEHAEEGAQRAEEAARRAEETVRLMQHRVKE